MSGLISALCTVSKNWWNAVTHPTSGKTGSLMVLFSKNIRNPGSWVDIWATASEEKAIETSTRERGLGEQGLSRKETWGVKVDNVTTEKYEAEGLIGVARGDPGRS